jgi:hypothetical protein
MIYLNITINVHKQKIDSNDKLIIGAAYLNIFFGFLPIILSKEMAIVSIFLSGFFL